MAEVLGAVGSRITIVALFKGCVDAFDFIQPTQQQDRDYALLATIISVQRARLYLWGSELGLNDTDDEFRTKRLQRLENLDPMIRTPIISSLQVLEQLLRDSDKLQQRYGCEPASGSWQRPSAASVSFARIFNDFSTGKGKETTPRASKHRIRCVINDAKKFKDLTKKVKGLVGSLCELSSDLVSIRQNFDALSKKLEELEDEETWELVSEGCQDMNPGTSELMCRLSDRQTVLGPEDSHTRDEYDDSANHVVDRWLQYEEMPITELKRQLHVSNSIKRKLRGRIDHKVRSLTAVQSPDQEGLWKHQGLRAQIAHPQHVELKRQGRQAQTGPSQRFDLKLPYRCNTFSGHSRHILVQCCIENTHTCAFEGWSTLYCSDTIVSQRDVLDVMSQPGRCVKVYSIEGDSAYQDRQEWMRFFRTFGESPRHNTCPAPNHWERWDCHLVPLSEQWDVQEFVGEVFRRLSIDQFVSTLNPADLLPYNAENIFIAIMVSPERPMPKLLPPTAPPLRIVGDEAVDDNDRASHFGSDEDNDIVPSRQAEAISWNINLTSNSGQPAPIMTTRVVDQSAPRKKKAKNMTRDVEDALRKLSLCTYGRALELDTADPQKRWVLPRKLTRS
jgi:hypothetical protein